MKILILISGGVLQAVYASSEQVAVTLLDMDDLTAEGKTGVERETELEKQWEGLVAVY